MSCILSSGVDYCATVYKYHISSGNMCCCYTAIALDSVCVWACWRFTAQWRWRHYTVILHSKFKTRDRHTIAGFGKFQLSWWRHQMGTFSALLAFVRGIYNSGHFATWHGQTVAFSKDLSHTSGRNTTHKDLLSLLVLSLVSYPGPLFLRGRRGLFLKRTPVSLPLLTEEVIRYGGSIVHDDVIKWKHFQRYWPFVWGNHRSPVNSPNKCQWRGALMFSLFCTRINGWVNTREAGDLIRHRTHHDAIVMWLQYFICHWFCIHITKTSENAFYVRKS